MRVWWLLLLIAALGNAAVMVREKDHDSAEETLAETERHFRKLIQGGFKIALPYLMEAVTEMRVNRTCLQGLMHLLRGVMDIRDWAIKMVDALGKPSAGILEGTATAMGDYDECLDIRVPRRWRRGGSGEEEGEVAWRGKYCVIQIHLPPSLRKAAMEYQAGNRTLSPLANTRTFLRNLVKIAPRADVADLRLGVCIPSVCTIRDLQAIIDEVSTVVKLSATAVRCEGKHTPRWDTEKIVIVCLLGVVALLSVAGTTADVILRFRAQQPDQLTEHMKSKKKPEWLLAFSVRRNLANLVSLESEEGCKTGCVRGVTFISICLYIVVWTYATPHDFHFLKYRSAFYFHRFMEEWWFTVFANASAGVDTLFLVAGLQISYRFWWKNKGRHLSVSNFIFKWYTRFSLCQCLVMGLTLCLPLMGNGPIWGDVVTPTVLNCRRRGWLNLLALNNFWNTNDTCLPHTWLVCCIFHMLLLAPILLLIMSKSLAVGVFVNVAVIFGSSVAVAMVTLMNDLPPAPAFYFLSFINIKSIWQNVFIQAYDHVGPFCVGILLGYLINARDKVTLSKRSVVLGWTLSVSCNLAVLCGLYGYRHGEPMDMALSAVYAATHRVVWSLGIAWIVFACAYGYGGFADSVLSWRVLVPCWRLAPLTYLVHPLVQLLHEGQLRERMYMAHLDQAMYATAYIVFTVGAAGLCYVTCVAPFLHFERRLWYYDHPQVEIPSSKKEIK